MIKSAAVTLVGAALVLMIPPGCTPAAVPAQDPRTTARTEIRHFGLGFGTAQDFTPQQIDTYITNLIEETYSTVVTDPVEYYVVTGDGRSRPTKSKVVVQPASHQKACSLELQAGNLVVTAVYISASSGSPITRPLFPEKWSPTMTHTGFAGPGLEISVPAARREDFKTFLDTFSIYYRVSSSTGGDILGYVIPDLVQGSDRDGTPYPHFGRTFEIEHGDRPIIFRVDGTKGMPGTTIATYRQALGLKTYLKMTSASQQAVVK